MNKPKYFINGITVRKYCRDNNIPFGSVQHRLARGMSVEEALNYEFKKRTLNTDTELYGVKRSRKISFLKGKGYSRHEAVLRSFTKTELIAICQTLYNFVDNAKVKELYKDFKYDELKQDD